MEDNIREAIKLLKDNGYIIKKWTPEMERDADECERMDMVGKSKDCCGCTCGVCLIQLNQLTFNGGTHEDRK